jgi:hypothetical protein
MDVRTGITRQLFRLHFVISGSGWSQWLRGRVLSPSQGRYLHTEQHKHRINAYTDIHALSGIRTHDYSARASEDSSCLIPRGHCDRRCFFTMTLNYNHLKQLTIGDCLMLVPFPSWTTSVFRCGWLVNFLRLILLWYESNSNSFGKLLPFYNLEKTKI